MYAAPFSYENRYCWLEGPAENVVGLKIYRRIAGRPRLRKWRLLSDDFDVLHNAEFQRFGKLSRELS